MVAPAVGLQRFEGQWTRESNYLQAGPGSMPFLKTTKAVFTDSHFLIPLVVFAIGLALLITLH
jgi:hypothetical protein